MNESRKTNKFQLLLNKLESRFTSMNKGSKMLVRIAFFILSALLIAALFLILTYAAGVIRFNNQIEIGKWIVLYSFRAWALIFCGALILDYLIGGQSK